MFVYFNLFSYIAQAIKNSKIMKKVLTIIGSIVAIFAIIIFIGGSYFTHQFKQMMINGGFVVEWNTTDGETLKDLSYGEGYRNRYDLYLPANKKPKALMLFIHGGSWVSGEKEDMAWAAQRYAKEGYITASINYTRLRTDSITYSSPYEKPCMQSMLAEIDSSIKAITAKCKELGCNISQMAIGGYSAGAHLAMLYSTLYATKSPLPIKFQISWVGPSDFNALFPTDPNINSGGAAPIEERAKFLGEMGLFLYSLSGNEVDVEKISAEDVISIKSNISPVDKVTTDTPPAVLAYGGNDRLVNAIHGEEMSQALTSKGIANRLIIFPNSGHELGHDPECTESVQATILEFCEEYFQ